MKGLRILNLIIVSLFAFAVFLSCAVWGGPIHDAAKKGDLAKVKSILAKNPELLNAKDEKGWTLLHIVASCGYKDIAELLLVKGADVNAEGTNGWTPLHWAASWGNGDGFTFY